MHQPSRPSGWYRQQERCFAYLIIIPHQNDTAPKRRPRRLVRGQGEWRGSACAGSRELLHLGEELAARDVPRQTDRVKNLADLLEQWIRCIHEKHHWNTRGPLAFPHVAQNLGSLHVGDAAVHYDEIVCRVDSELFENQSVVPNGNRGVTSCQAETGL